MKTPMPKWLVCISHFVGHVPHLDHRSERSITDQCQKGESHFVQKLPKVLLLNHTYFLGIWSKTFSILDSSAPAMALPLFQSTVCWCVS